MRRKFSNLTKQNLNNSIIENNDEDGWRDLTFWITTKEFWLLRLQAHYQDELIKDLENTQINKYYNNIIGTNLNTNENNIFNITYDKYGICYKFQSAIFLYSMLVKKSYINDYFIFENIWRIPMLKTLPPNVLSTVATHYIAKMTMESNDKNKNKNKNKNDNNNDDSNTIYNDSDDSDDYHYDPYHMKPMKRQRLKRKQISVKDIHNNILNNLITDNLMDNDLINDDSINISIPKELMFDKMENNDSNSNNNNNKNMNNMNDMDNTMVDGNEFSVNQNNTLLSDINGM